MTVNRLLLMSGACSVLAGLPAAGLAQQRDELEVIIVTGSYIRGMAEDAALPVDVISAQDLEKLGSPSMVELMKHLNVSSGVLGETNQFAAGAQGNEGAGSVNLRGLGRNRTLVLLNGRRLVNHPFTGAPDTNFIPLAAVGRIEILKDGAAATYGSDAIGGVVNFITKDRLEGFDIGGNYKYVDGSDGDYEASIAYGWQGESASLVLAGGYQHRSELRVTERDFAMRGYMENPQSWSSSGHPGTILAAPFAPLAATVFRDPGCGDAGGFAGFTDTQIPVCYFNYVPFDNLVEEENRFQVFGKFTADIGASTEFHFEAMYADTEIPEYRTSPSYLANQGPTAGAGPGQSIVNGRYFIPANNPGLQSFLAQNPGHAAAFPGLGAVGAFDLVFRPFATGGNPATGTTNIGSRDYSTYRFSTGLLGQFGADIGWDLAVTYMETEAYRNTPDILVSRLQAALKGFGGPNCTGSTPGANGCLWYNPFSNAVERNAITGQANPRYDAAVTNSSELAQWLFEDNDQTFTSRLLVVDAVIGGETGWALGGGNVGWAAGAQYRDSRLKIDYHGFADLDDFPCVDLGSTACLVASPTNPVPVAGSPFMFLGGGVDNKLSGDVFGVFGELSLPFSTDFQAQLAVRYEDYGGLVGSTLDPKLSLRWQATDWLALRGSVGTTFRGPVETDLSPNSVTALSFVNQAGAFRAIRVFGTPDLEPESAFTYNVGMLFRAGGLRASIDYWSFDFEKPLVTESFSAIVDQVFQSGVADCSSPAAARILFTTGECVNGAAGATIGGVVVRRVNGPDVKTDGIDFSGEYTWHDVLRGSFTLGASASRALSFEVDALFVEGVQVSQPFDGVGLANIGTGYTPLPAWKGDLFIEYSAGRHNLRWVARYVDSYRDNRNIFTARPSTGGVALTQGSTIGSWTTHDLNYVLQLPAQTMVFASISNVFDEDPPFARLDLSYDPFSHTALGRTFQVGARKTF